MDIKHLSAIFCFFFFFIFAAFANKTPTNTSEFIATKDWQEVKEGQAIPQGLHVRINLQTGVKEAKLLDESERERGNALQGQAINTEPLGLDYNTIIEESVRKVKEKRDYAELRKAYKEFQKNFQTDGEIIIQLLNQFRNFSKPPASADLKAKLDTLENLEYLVHQIDNALLFIDEGGLDDVLLPIVVNDTNTALRVSAMRVLGALTGNNPKAQIKVFERNFGSYLAQILMTSPKAEFSSALHALGALLRKFPLAQQHILSTSGTQALVVVLRSKDVDFRIKGKAISLISDLVLEKRFVLESSEGAPDTAAEAQYLLLDFENWLQTHNYCSVIDTIVSEDFLLLLELPEVVEQFEVALTATEDLCQGLWSESPQLRHALLTMRNRLARSDNEYQVELSQMLTKLIDELYSKRVPRKTEL